MSKEVRVLLADDSPTMRRALTMFLSQDSRLEVIGTARDGMEVLQMARFMKPDVISMDVQMPQLDGLEATRRIMADCPCRIVVVSSYTEDSEMNLSFNAIQAGALELFGKPRAGDTLDMVAWGRNLSDLLVRVAAMPLSLSIRTPVSPALSLELPGASLDIFGLAASTGGPPTLADLLEKLPSDFPLPILVAQHMTEGFTGGFRRWLGQACAIPVEFAEEGKAPQPNRIYLAPDGCHLEVDPHRLFRLLPQNGGFFPSGDRLFFSLAQAFGSRAGGAVLTGMGEDGGRGLLALRQAGGVTLAQNEASCVVYGMPRFARELGAVQQCLSPAEMTLALQQLCRNKSGTPDKNIHLKEKAK